MPTGNLTGPSNRPVARVADYQIALQLATTFSAKAEVVAHLTELRDATAGFDQARAASEAAATAAQGREEKARQAEGTSERARQAQADEATVIASRHAGERAELDRDRQRADEVLAQGERQADTNSHVETKLHAVASALQTWLGD